MPRLLPALPVLALLFGLLCLPATAQAHKVNVFAYVDGPNLVLDCFFSKSDKVNKGAVSVLDAASGEVLARGVTDEKGALTLPVPQEALATGHDLKVLLKAGEGHQSDTLIRASEFAGLRPAAASAKPVAKTPDRPAAKTLAAAPAAPAAIDEALLTRIVEQAVDSRMGPVKRLLLESAQKGPGPTEIVGGIGYIVGLFGVAAFIASRRKDRGGK